MQKDAIDVEQCNGSKIITSYPNYESRLNGALLLEIQNDLDETEMISLFFLMSENHTNCYDRVVPLLYKQCALLEFVKVSLHKWKSKLIESLCIIENYEVLRRLRFSENEILEIKRIYCPADVNISVEINKYIKFLYVIVCKGLNIEEANKLLNLIYSEMKEPNINSKILELHMWYWIKQGYISIGTDKADLYMLKKYLSKVSHKIYVALTEKLYETESNKDSEVISETIVRNNNLCEINNIQKNIKTLQQSSARKEGMCIIINEVEFAADNKLDYRLGSDIDCNSLKETFSGLGFEVISHDNQSLSEVKRIFLSCKRYHDRKCLVVCILSHGDQSGVILSDGQKISLDDLDNLICRKELRNVFKLVIVQSCQGKEVGVPPVDEKPSKLTADGPVLNVPSIEDRKQFVLFKASLKGYISMRHTKEGSWFIQELCNVLQESKVPVKMTSLTQQVTKLVSKKRGQIDDQEAMQLPEVVTRSVEDYEFPLYTKT